MEITLTGTIHEGTYTAKGVYEGTVFPYFVHIPACAQGRDNCALLVTHDGLNRADAWAMEQLAETGEAPPCITVGIVSGTLPLEGGVDRGMRMLNYDMFTRDYPDFVADEFLPYLTETYDLHISPSPDMHMTSGGSSGGISAWNMAWYRTDVFRRVYMSSPSFLSMGNGREIPALIRKVETKPIRVWTEFSEHEPDDYFGSSYCAADDAERALRFAGYDMMSAYYPGEGHCSRNGNPENALERMRFLWKNWDSEPITVKKLSPRMEKLISVEYPWEETDDFPKKTDAVTPAGRYTVERGTIRFTADDGSSRVVGDAPVWNVPLAVSPDMTRLYMGKSGGVIAMTIRPDGGLAGRFVHAALHMETDLFVSGAYDLCASSDDRLYAATESGIQCIRSFGLIDAIVPLPDGLVPREIEFDTVDGMTYLYARTGNKIFRRRWLQGGRVSDTPTEVLNRGYYD